MTALLTATPESGAGNGAQTHDLDLGKVALYQLSYTRVPALNRLRVARSSYQL